MPQKRGCRKTTPKALRSSTTPQVDQFAHSQAMAEGHKDHGGVAVVPTFRLGSRNQAVDLTFGEMLPGAQFRVQAHAAGISIAIR